MKRTRRALFGVAVVWLGGALSSAGCQDGYPLAATRCDRWCELTRATACGDYQPADCVVKCESSLGGPGCEVEFEALLTCLEQHQSALVCDYTRRISSCQTEQTALQACTDRRAPHALSSAE